MWVAPPQDLASVAVTDRRGGIVGGVVVAPVGLVGADVAGTDGIVVGPAEGDPEVDVDAPGVADGAFWPHAASTNTSVSGATNFNQPAGIRLDPFACGDSMTVVWSRVCEWRPGSDGGSTVGGRGTSRNSTGNWERSSVMGSFILSSFVMRNFWHLEAYDSNESMRGFGHSMSGQSKTTVGPVPRMFSRSMFTTMCRSGDPGVGFEPPVLGLFMPSSTDACGKFFREIMGFFSCV
jgi:hypothetical protein